jgi:hypothetical protein
MLFVYGTKEKHRTAAAQSNGPKKNIDSDFRLSKERSLGE